MFSLLSVLVLLWLMKLANGHPIKKRCMNHYASEPLHSPWKCRDRLHRYELGHKCPSPIKLGKPKKGNPLLIWKKHLTKMNATNKTCAYLLMLWPLCLVPDGCGYGPYWRLLPIIKTKECTKQSRVVWKLLKADLRYCYCRD